MPFKSRAQKEYLRINEPEIYERWMREYDAESNQSFTPPAAAVAAAKKGLAQRKKWGRGGLSPAEAASQGIDSGVTRARKISSGKVSRHDVRRMSAFNRHRKNNNPSKKMPDGGPTAGTIAWNLWGGSAGVNWAKKKSAAMNAESSEEDFACTDYIIEEIKRIWYSPAKKDIKHWAEHSMAGGGLVAYYDGFDLPDGSELSEDTTKDEYFERMFDIFLERFEEGTWMYSDDDHGIMMQAWRVLYVPVGTPVNVDSLGNWENRHGDQYGVYGDKITSWLWKHEIYAGAIFGHDGIDHMEGEEGKDFDRIVLTAWIPWEAVDWASTIAYNISIFWQENELCVRDKEPVYELNYDRNSVVEASLDKAMNAETFEGSGDFTIHDVVPSYTLRGDVLYTMEISTLTGTNDTGYYDKSLNRHKRWFTERKEIEWKTSIPENDLFTKREEDYLKSYDKKVFKEFKELVHELDNDEFIWANLTRYTDGGVWLASYYGPACWWKPQGFEFNFRYIDDKAPKMVHPLEGYDAETEGYCDWCERKFDDGLYEGDNWWDGEELCLDCYQDVYSDFGDVDWDAESFESPVSCKICGKTFDSFRGLNGHMNAHLPPHRKRAEMPALTGEDELKTYQVSVPVLHYYGIGPVEAYDEDEAADEVRNNWSYWRRTIEDNGDWGGPLWRYSPLTSHEPEAYEIFASETFGDVDPDGQLAQALRAAREKSRYAPQPLRITKLPHPDQKTLKDFEAETKELPFSVSRKDIALVSFGAILGVVSGVIGEVLAEFWLDRYRRDPELVSSGDDENA